MNNLKKIRELYGATQEQIALAINVNRVTVANWENGTSVASSSNQERLSIYYGIGPEFFYQKALDGTAQQMILDTAAKAKEIVEASDGKKAKKKILAVLLRVLVFKRLWESICFL